MISHPTVSLISYPMIADERIFNTLNYEVTDEEPWASDPDLLYELAGRGCYRSWHKPNPATQTNHDYLQRSIIDNKHFSVIEHGMYVFEIQGVSRALLAELTRHRILSFSVESLRFCPPRDYVIHPVFQSRMNQFETLLDDAWTIALKHYFEAFDTLVADGVPKKKAREASRMLLPMMTATDMVVSANGRAWWDVLTKRWDPAADEEIFELVAIIFEQLRKAAPHTFNNFPLPGSS